MHTDRFPGKRESLLNLRGAVYQASTCTCICLPFVLKSTLLGQRMAFRLSKTLFADGLKYVFHRAWPIVHKLKLHRSLSDPLVKGAKHVIIVPKLTVTLFYLTKLSL